MSLMPPPGVQDDWSGLRPGDKQQQQLPSGPYDFVFGEEPAIGLYQSYSLFSPMFEFVDQQTVIATAEAVMQGIMKDESRDSVSTWEQEISRIWQAEEDTEAEAGVADPPVQLEAQTESRLEQKISRRDLLRGAFIGSSEP